MAHVAFFRTRTGPAAKREALTVEFHDTAADSRDYRWFSVISGSEQFTLHFADRADEEAFLALLIRATDARTDLLYPPQFEAQNCEPVLPDPKVPERVDTAAVDDTDRQLAPLSERMAQHVPCSGLPW